jgi:hypothetical protein
MEIQMQLDPLVTKLWELAEEVEQEAGGEAEPEAEER